MPHGCKVAKVKVIQMKSARVKKAEIGAKSKGNQQCKQGITGTGQTRAGAYPVGAQALWDCGL